MTNKYNARKTEIDGYTFDSKAEANRYWELRELEKNGDITDLRVHPKYLILDSFMYRGHKVGQTHYIADFEYQEKSKVFIDHWHTVVEDVKGVETAVFRIKAKLFKYCYPNIDFRVVR